MATREIPAARVIVAEPADSIDSLAVVVNRETRASTFFIMRQDGTGHVAEVTLDQADALALVEFLSREV